MIMDKGACCCCVHISCKFMYRVSCLFYNIYFQHLCAGLGYRHPPGPSMPRVQKNPFAPTSALGWTPGNFQSELQDPYLESIANLRGLVQHAGFLAMGVASPCLKVDPKDTPAVAFSRCLLQCFGQTPRTCDVTTSRETSTCRAPVSSGP